MKLLITVVEDIIVPGLVEKLLQKGIRVTQLTSSGGFFKRGNTTLLSGIEDDDVPVAVQTIKEYSEKRKLERIDNSKAKQSNNRAATILIVPLDKILHF